MIKGMNERNPEERSYRGLTLLDRFYKIFAKVLGSKQKNNGGKYWENMEPDLAIADPQLVKC